MRDAILGKSKQLTKDEALALDVVSIKNGITRLELIDAIANYHKHHDEGKHGNQRGETSAP